MAIRRRFGAQFQGNGRTCFGLWAPDAREVRVETADGRDWPLEGSDSGWFEATLPCPPGTRYRYRIDGRPGVPDPASQFQPDGVHGHSQVLDHGAYAWRVDEWRGRPWHEAVIYELHVGLFGSYAEVERFLPRLVELGVTAVELMPLGEFPGRRNWGYDGVLPFAPASAYGTPEQLKHLIDSAHGMGLMVFVDVIYNHFGPDGNYLAQYAAAFFRDDRQTPWGQAIDFRRGEVREFFYENALMWLLDYRVDGLRFDAVHAIPDSAFLVEMARRLRGAAGPERHVHLVLENDDNRASLLRQGYDAQWNDDGHHALHVLLTGENDGYYQDYPEPLRCLARCLAEGFVYQGEANRHGRPRGEPSADLAPDAFVLFLQNHDQVGNRAFGERLSVLAEPQVLRLAIALQLLAPMIPLLFMGDVAGRLFREFAITLAVAILISGFVSLTLTPMLSAKLLRHIDEDQQGRFARAAGRVIDGLIAQYAKALRVVLRHQPLTLLVAIATLALTALLYLAMPKGFFPVQDTGVIQGVAEAPQSISFQAMSERQRALAEVVLKDPAVASLSSYIGVDGSNPTLNTGRLLINLKPHSERDVTASEVIQRLQPELDHLPGINLYMQPVQDLTIEDRVARTQYQFTLQDADPDVLAEWVPKLVARLQELPQLADVASDWQDKGLQAYLNIDRDTASRLGVKLSDIDSVLYNAFGQRLISTIFTQATQYRVVLEVAPQFQLGPQALEQLYVPSSDGTQVRLSSLAKVEERHTLLAINHIAQFPSATLSFNLAKGYSLGEAVEAIRGVEASLELPLSMQGSFRGAALAFEASLSNTLLLILASVVTMYIVLGILYESFIHPVTILSTLPSAGVGALLALILCRSELSLIALIGIILLIGIVKKNAIMMIDFALEAERNHGLSPREAILEACMMRFRPIMMTTLAALLGALPLIFGIGGDAALRRPLGITIVGGLIGSQLLTLYTTPVVYLYLDRLRHWVNQKRGVRTDGALETPL